MSAELIERALRVFCTPGQVVSIQALYGPGRAVSVVTSDPAGAAREAVRLDGTRPLGVYFTPNPIREGLDPGAFPKNPDVTLRHWLLVDVDPHHPSGTSSTDAERAAAWIVLLSCRSVLEGAGLRGAVVGDSGNGFHLCYPVRLPNDEPAAELLRDVLHALQARCGDALDERDKVTLKARQFLPTPKAKVDVGCFDAKRIWKLPGTTARKGPDLPETVKPDGEVVPARPHRVAGLLEGEPWDEGRAESNTALLPGVLRSLLETFEDLKQFDAAFQPGRGTPDREAAYCREGLKRECAVVAAAVVGTRNAQLTKSAFAVGQLVGTGKLGYQEAFNALYLAALDAGCDDPRKDKGTIGRGLRDGMKQPRRIDLSEPHAAAPAPVPSPIDVKQTLIDRACDITPRVVEWLWPGVIPLGKLTTFAGVGGLGKTFVLCDITARVSTGAEWPCSGGARAPLGQVLFISGEDDPDDTLVPRLSEMGADLNRVTFLKTAVLNKFTLADLNVLRAALAQTGPDVRLVVIDPPTAYLGGVDDHKNAELRGLLAPLAALASHYRLAAAFNTHVNKQAGKVDAMMRVMGSVAWVNAVRAAHLFIRDPDDPNRRFFLPMKMNLARERKGLAYAITPTEQLARVDWLGEVDVTADEAVSNGNHATPRQKAAADWLIDRFRERLEWSSEELFRLANAEGISRNAVFEAKRALDLPKPRKSTGQDGTVSWCWWVPTGWPQLDLRSLVERNSLADRNGGTVELVEPKP